jgi:DNA repair exonuclease SbcCD nuclease subunit
MAAMLRLLHTADVHLGARHADLGEQAAAQREQQFEAFRATVDLAARREGGPRLIAGDLFDSNTQPGDRWSGRPRSSSLAEATIRTVIIPGTHDVYRRRVRLPAYDLAALPACRPTATAWWS